MPKEISVEMKIALEKIFTKINAQEADLKIMNSSLKTLNDQIKSLRETRDAIIADKKKLIEEAKEQMISLESLLKENQIENNYGNQDSTELKGD